MAFDYLELLTGKKLGEFFIDKFSDYEQTKKLATEVWESKDASLLTLEQEAYTLEITYHQKIKQAISCIVYTLSPELLEQLKDRGIFYGDIYHSDEEMVVVKSSIAIIFFQKTNDGSFRSIKTQFPVTPAQVELIQKLFTKLLPAN